MSYNKLFKTRKPLMIDASSRESNLEKIRITADGVSQQVPETEQAARQLQTYAEEVEESLSNADRELQDKEKQLIEKENEIKAGTGPTVAGYAVSELAAAFIRPPKPAASGGESQYNSVVEQREKISHRRKKLKDTSKKVEEMKQAAEEFRKKEKKLGDEIIEKIKEVE